MNLFVSRTEDLLALIVLPVGIDTLRVCHYYFFFLYMVYYFKKNIVMIILEGGGDFCRGGNDHLHICSPASL